MKAFRVFAAICAIILAAGCYPVTTSHPVGTTTGLSADPALAGLWRAEMANSPDETAYFHFLPMQAGGFEVVIVSGGKKPDGEWNVAQVTAAKLGAHRFLNAVMVFNNGKQENDPAHGTVPLLYRQEPDGRITLFLISEDAAKNAIRRGLTAGAIEPGNLGDVTLNAEPGDLDKFFAGDDGVRLFTEKFATLTRMDQ